MTERLDTIGFEPSDQDSSLASVTAFQVDLCGAYRQRKRSGHRKTGAKARVLKRTRQFGIRVVLLAGTGQSTEPQVKMSGLVITCARAFALVRRPR